MKRELSLILAGTYSVAVTSLVAALTATAVQDPSALTFSGLLVGAGFLLPVKFFYLNYENIYGQSREKIKEEKYTWSITSALFLLSWISFTKGLVFPGSNILNLSFHASAQIFLPVTQQYQTLGGDSLGNLSFNLGRWLLQIMYLYLTTGLVIDVSSRVRKIN